MSNKERNFSDLTGGEIPREANKAVLDALGNIRKDGHGTIGPIAIRILNGIEPRFLRPYAIETPEYFPPIAAYNIQVPTDVIFTPVIGKTTITHVPAMGVNPVLAKKAGPEELMKDLVRTLFVIHQYNSTPLRFIGRIPDSFPGLLMPLGEVYRFAIQQQRRFYNLPDLGPQELHAESFRVLGEARYFSGFGYEDWTNTARDIIRRRKPRVDLKTLEEIKEPLTFLLARYLYTLEYHEFAKRVSANVYLRLPKSQRYRLIALAVFIRVLEDRGFMI